MSGTLGDFVRECLERREVLELVLRYVGEAGTHEQQTDLGSEAFGKGKRPRADELERRFSDMAHEHAATLRGRQRYRLVGLRRGGKPFGSHAFTVTAPGDEEIAGDAKDVAKQALRHSEKLHRIVVKQSDQVASALAGLLAIVTDRLEKMERFVGDGLAKQAELTAQLADRQHERELEKREQDQELKREDELWDVGKAGAQLILARATGSLDVAELLKSIPDEQRAALFSTLDDEQRKRLGRILALAKSGEDATDKLMTGALAAQQQGAPPNGSPSGASP